MKLFYDRAGRITSVKDPANLELKRFEYAAANDGPNWKLGKLEVAIAANHYVDVLGAPQNLQIQETFTYGGKGGATSQLSTSVGADTTFQQAFTWNQLGQLDTLTYPQLGAVGPARTVTNSYVNGALTGVSDAAHIYASSISYHGSGAMHQLTHGNGTVDTIRQDPFGMARPAAITVTRGGNVLWGTGEYLYDGAGNITNIGTQVFAYDKVNRLKSGTILAGGEHKTQAATYDAFGSITSMTTDGALFQAQVDSQTNRLLSVPYDAAGQQLSWNDGGYSYSWYPTGAMRSFLGEQRKTTYFYNTSGERIAWYDTSDDTTHVTLRGLGGQILREYAGTGGVWTFVRDHVYRGSAPLAVVDASGAVQHMHLDHLGSVRRMTDAVGEVVVVREYFPFGGFAWNDDLSSRQAFTGHERDHRDTSSTTDDLDYMHARYYNPNLGRFLSVDPVGGMVGSSQSWNRYAYVMNNPLLFVDLYGESVSLANLDDDQRSELLRRLSEFTGNTYEVDDDGNLQLVSVGESSSATATEFLNALISPDAPLFCVSATQGSSNNPIGTTDALINLKSKDGMISPDGIDTTAFNLGSTLIHELWHAATGAGDVVGMPRGVSLLDWRGGAVEFVNDIRAERGFHLRNAWGYRDVSRGFLGRRVYRQHIFVRGGVESRIWIP